MLRLQQNGYRLWMAVGGLMALALVLVALVWPVSIHAQNPLAVGLSGTTTTMPFREYATRELGDPWDMSQRTDIGWLTWGIDESANLAGKTMSGGVFSGTPVNHDPQFYLLDTWQPGAAKIGKLGVNYPIETSTYTHMIVKMKVTNQVLASAFGSVGVPQAQVYWSRNTAYYMPDRTDGGLLTTADANGGPANIPLTSLVAQPFGAIEGGNWVIYRFPLTVAGLQSVNHLITQWKNINPGGASANWGAGGVTADSLRLDPINISGATIGAIQFDWVRLVNYNTSNPTTVNWSNSNSYDVVVSTSASCSNFAVVGYSVKTGFQFQSQMLPPGTYYVGLRSPFTSTGQTGSGSTPVSCSTATVTVHALPSMAMTSPNVEGNADDFATTQLNDAWDFNALTDFDWSVNTNLPNASYGLVMKNATDPAGNDLGSVRVFRSLSTATPGIGDPHLYMLWPTREQPGARFRGENYRIDTSRYRIATMEMGVERQRDLSHGSVGRLIWHVDGEKRANGNLAEIESSDILIRHLDPVSENGGKIVLDTIQVDMKDRGIMPVEPDYPQPGSGWNNGCSPNPGVTTCHTTAGTYKGGVDLFRLDMHEFSPASASYVKRIKLAALERTGSSFQIRWTPSNPSTLSATVTLKAIATANPSGGNYRPADRTCASGATIATNVSLAGGSHTWVPSGLPNNAEYFVCAQIIVGGTVVDEEMSRWPVVIDTASAAPKPLLRVDRSTLRFTGLRSGVSSPVFLSKTPDETLRLTQSGAGTVHWNASITDTRTGAPVSWLTMSPSSGTGGGTVTIGLANDPSIINCTAIDGMKATIALTSPGMGNSPQYIQVYATMFWNGGVCPNTGSGTTGAFGQVDTPVQNASNLTGSIGVTGWALDDVGISAIRLYRNCLSFEAAANCEMVAGRNVVFMGNADIVPGARPDVEAAYQSHPQGYKAGWGFLLLTNMLPHIPSQRMFGGQGTLQIGVLVTDMEQNQRWLGRTVNDQTPTTVALNNDAATRPFGAIDAPGQGEVVSGGMWNFGWALTPDSNTGADGSDIVVPTNGSTIRVWINGAPASTAIYNLCRGSVGSPPSPGVYCDDDVANIFGNSTPQPALQGRTSNPTKYRNLDMGRGAMAAYYLDTTLLPNGRHSIVWSVTDSANRADGIGSRDFIVFNGGQGPMGMALEEQTRSLGDATQVTALALDESTIKGRTTFSVNAGLEVVNRHSSGVRYVRIPELGRLELHVGQRATAGYLVANGILRPLPAGSQLRDGTFTWAPGVGFVGDYNLVFVSDVGQVSVVVTIFPDDEGPRIETHVDQPRVDRMQGGTLRLTGWAADLTSWQGSGVGAVHVWALPQWGGQPQFLGAAELGQSHPDVASAAGAQFEQSGWSLTTSPLARGTYEVVAYVWSSRTGRFETARSVTVTVR
jgi:hypothetical protein